MSYFCKSKRIIVMETRTYTTPLANKMIVTLEDDATVSEIRKALLMIRGIASVRVVKESDLTVTPALRSSIRKARKESANGETIVCSSPEEMQQYFDSL